MTNEMTDFLTLKLGIAGTAKNTGKTTVTAAILAELRQRGKAFCLTSIGYDGENLDNVTGLPKPRLHVEPGDLVATAEKCLAAGTAKLKLLAQTSIRTPLGRIFLGRVTAPGLVVTAGPNKRAEVRALAGCLAGLGADTLLLDGAMNRIAPMVEADGFILATGAARDPDIFRLARETGYIWRLTALPALPGASRLAVRNYQGIVALDADMEEQKNWPTSSLLTEEDVGQILSELKEPLPAGGYLYVPGIISSRALAGLAERLSSRKNPLWLVFADPIKLLVAGQAETFCRLLAQLPAAVTVAVLKRAQLLAVTVNPFYPEYRFETQTYKPASVDAASLRAAVQQAVPVPVFNVVEDGAAGLVDAVLKQISCQPPAVGNFFF